MESFSTLIGSVATAEGRSGRIPALCRAPAALLGAGCANRPAGTRTALPLGTQTALPWCSVPFVAEMCPKAGVAWPSLPGS